MSDQINPKQAIMGLIYKKVNDLLGAGSQLFCMQFPAQPLNYRQYQYDTNERTSVLTRPYTIAEAEFRLSDKLFDVYPITAGSNGEQLSVVYNTLLNNYVPSLKPFAAYFKDRAELSKFLLKEIDTGNGNKRSRIDLCKELYDAYLQAKLAWEKDKEATFDDIKDLSDQENSSFTLDDYAKWLSSEGMVREAELNNLYNDAVVKGYLHEILTVLGYLNVSSIAEELELAKQRMRHSVRLSLDESMLVYPVQFQPSNWFEGLTPNLSPVDLTMAEQTIRDQLRAKRRELSRAQSELRVLEMLSVGEDEIKKLEAEVAQGKKALNDKESELVEAYGQAVVTAAKIYLSTQSQEGSLIKLAEKDTITPATQPQLDKLGLSDGDGVSDDKLLGYVNEAVTKLHDTYKAQKAVLQKAEEWTFLKSQLARAKSQDLRFEKINLNQRIRDLHADIEDLGELMAGVYRENQNGQPKKELPVIPTAVKVTEADGMFMDVIIKSEEIERSSQLDRAASVTEFGWNINWGLFSAGGQHSNSQASTSAENNFFSQTIEIGFRVAKVTFDRGGWFNPQIFKMSHAFYRLADLKASPGLTKNQFLDLLKKAAIAAEAAKNDSNKKDDSAEKLQALFKDKDGKSYILPAYPVAMIIAKDITIKVKQDASQSEATRTILENSNTAGGGFLGFSCSYSSASSSSTDKTFYGQQGDYFYIRIPGPQILGYYLQFVPQDNAQPYEAIFQEIGDSEIEKALKAYDLPAQTAQIPPSN